MEKKKLSARVNKASTNREGPRELFISKIFFAISKIGGKKQAIYQALIYLAILRRLYSYIRPKLWAV